jgi:type I restriction enzyme S subunit
MFARLPRYTQTRANDFWASPVPAHWQAVPGMAVVNENKRRNTGLVESQVLSLSYGRVIIKPVEKQHGLVPESYEGYQILDPDDIVVRPTDLQNDQTSIRVGLVRDRGIITSAYIGLRPKVPWTTGYAHVYLATVDSTKRIYGMGSGLRQQLGWADLKRMPCLVPPADEQAAIVKYLAHANTRIDKAITAKRRLIALLQEQKRAAVASAMKSGSAGDRELRHVLRKLVDCEHKTAPYVEGTPWWILRTSAVRDGGINWDGAYTTDEASYRQWTSRAVPEPGDVIFTREAPVGEAAVITGDRAVALGQRTVLMKVRTDVIDPQFLVYQIYGGLPRERIALATQGSTVGHFNMDDIGWMRVAVPPLERQRELVNTVQQINSRADNVIDRERMEIALLDEFRTRLVADVVTGQVDVREIASALPAAHEPMGWGDSEVTEQRDASDIEELVEAGVD